MREALFFQYKKAIFFNAIIISQVLNYVDFRVFLTAVYDSTQYGGFVFINNVVDYGITPLFSENRPMNNAELQEFVTQMGFQIIEKTEIAPFFAQEKQPRLILILQKK